MTRALLLVARWIAIAHDHWRATVAQHRPLSARIDELEERVRRFQQENELLRARIRRIPLRRRPRYRGWGRLLILLHQARYGLSLRAMARAFVVSGQTIVNWHRDLVRRPPHLVPGRRPLEALPDLAADLVHRREPEWPPWETRRIAGILSRLRRARRFVECVGGHRDLPVLRLRAAA